MNKQTYLYTIGFAQKKAEEFFTILKVNHIKTLIDIRQSNTNIYAGFTIRDNLRYFLKEICGIEYIENKLFAPTKESGISIIKMMTGEDTKWGTSDCLKVATL